ncbi:MAG: DUF2197 domain-containing protein [Heliobacteriaceae bacterium]|nr:DUF2197 domain-containing protein [Heliobacteriaceae bacterium]
MEVRCMLCGKKETVGPDHPKWDQVEGKKKVLTYICLRCTAKIKYEADESLKIPKPM